MKKCGSLILFCLLVISPLWAAKKITVSELQEMLSSMHRAEKTDTEVADALKQVELTEELTPANMNRLVSDVPGKLATEQIYVLEASSAMLPPPSADIPSDPAPDANAQKAMLDKTAAYIAKSFAQLPSLTATKTTLRFQDNVEAVAPVSGMNSARDVSVGSAFVSPYQFLHYINATDQEISSVQGVEKLPEDKTRWGANRMIAVEEPDPSLSQVFSEAHSAGTIRWMRWENVNGKKMAVYSFQVSKKSTHFAINVCCFPEVSQTGKAFFSSATMPGGPGVSGNLQSNTQWKNFKATVPYHGELFVDPDSGTVVRLITEPEFKSSEIVRQQDTRVDYTPVEIDKQTYVVPTKTVLATEVVPSGDSGAARYSTRHTYFTSEYKNYRKAASPIK